MKKERNKAVPASYLILEKGDEVLLLRRYNTGYQDGNYSLPAGHVDAGEMPTDTMVRETKEEIGISINPADLTFAHVLYREAADETGDRVDFFYRASKWSGDITNCEPNKCDELKWYSLTTLPANMTPEVAHVLNLLPTGSHFSIMRNR